MRAICLLFFLFQSALSMAQRPKMWRAALLMEGATIDFVLEQKWSKADLPNYILHNGREAIDLNANRIERDSIVCPISIFDAELIFPARPGDQFSGFYRKHDTRMPNYQVPFRAEILTEGKSVSAPDLKFNWEGKWQIEFLNKGMVTDSGVAVFTMQGDSLYGTILSETGDYRFLNGRASGSSSYVQTFDGAHTYRFNFEEGGTGKFFYSLTGNQSFRWKKLTTNLLTNGFIKSRARAHELFTFKAKNAAGQSVTQDDPAFKGKALVVQVLGSWCPNCLDECRFLTEMYSQKPQNVEFVGLAFERKNDQAYVNTRLGVIKQRLKVPYPLFWAGMANKDSATKALPAITGVLSFPTTLFVKNDGTVLSVHTGFSGPATDMEYLRWKEEFEELLKKISR